MDVLPQHVYPANALWRAIVLVTAINETRQPIAVSADTSVHLATDAAFLIAAFAQINAEGRASGRDRRDHKSGGQWDAVGVDRCRSAGGRNHQYHDAAPTQLLVKALPSRVVNDGRTAVRVTVFLQDEAAGTVSAAATSW